ncbi:MAG: NADP-reducing hydrogenase subunit HndD [Rikenellaceae bacterium]|nr:NADP-reducing hydrogenase subunit HndD [Rikenellaceae bacterium]
MKINIVVNDQEYKIESGTNLLNALLSLGYDIPHLCYLENVSPNYACRLCVVEIEGFNKPIQACTINVINPLKIYTHSPKLIDIRRNVLELILSQHSLECNTCQKSIKCDLLNYALQYGVNEIIWRYIPTNTKEKDVSSPVIAKNINKCISCGICVKICNEMMHCNIFNHAFIGTKKTIISTMGKPINLSNCFHCGQCSYHCPTSALYEKSYLDVVNILPKETTLIFDPAAAYSLMSQINSNFTKTPVLSFINLCQFLGFKNLINLGEFIDAKLYMDYLTVKNLKTPVISNLCPASLEYIKQKFPELSEYISKTSAPLDAAIKLAGSDNPILILSNCSAYKNEAFQNYSSLTYNITVANVRDFLTYLLRNGYTLAQLNDLMPKIKSKNNYSYSIGGLYANISMYNLLKIVANESKMQLENGSKINFFLTGQKDNKNIDFLINKDKYSLVSLSTIEEINKFFKNEFSSNSLSLIECWACNDGCINGGGRLFESKYKMKKFLSSKNPLISQIYNINKDLIKEEALWKL